MITRRQALKTLGALAATPLLPSCGSTTPGTIDTFVFLLMENRSYDHYLGARSLLEGKPGDGLATGMACPDQNGASVASVQAASGDAMCVPSPGHEWNPSHVEFDGGTNDGFVKAYQHSYPGTDGSIAMSYMRREQVPVHNALADAYTSCDRWFSSILAGTLPNRMYWHAATANGARTNDDVLAGAYRGVTTLYHRLDAAGVPWAYYYNDVPVLAAIGSSLDLGDRIRRFVDFLADAAAGKLPAVSYIDPGFVSNDDHAPHHPLLGQQLIAAVYTALANSPQWSRCQLVVTYDEAGGFYDHVPPGTAPDDRAADGFDQLGFRVPALVVGPYARIGHVSSVPLEHTSCLRDIEKRYNLQPLTVRDAAANDLSSTVDDDRLAVGAAADPIQLPAVEIDESMLPPACQYGSSLLKPMADHDIVVWAQANSRRLGKLNRIPQAADTVYEIADYLDRNGVGRIRRGR